MQYEHIVVLDHVMGMLPLLGLSPLGWSRVKLRSSSLLYGNGQIIKDSGLEEMRKKPHVQEERQVEVASQVS